MTVAEPQHYDPVTRVELDVALGALRGEVEQLRGDFRAEIAARDRRLIVWAIGIALGSVTAGVAATGLMQNLVG